MDNDINKLKDSLESVKNFVLLSCNLNLLTEDGI